jgi:serine protease Do
MPRRLRLAGLGGLALLAWCVPAAGAAFDDLERRIIEIAEAVKPSVVHIEAIIRVNDRRNQVTGSGVVAHPNGRILTNHHVVDRAEKVTVSVPGIKKKYPARIVGTDKQTDIAVLRIQADRPLQAANFGSTDDVRVGQWVLAVGNPYGLDGTVSFGIVSAKGRNLELPDTLNDFIQTDAMIDRGSSGGPLVDLDGRVVGINSRGQGRGIGFTIPIDTALAVARQLEDGGVERGYLGITMQPVDRDLADYFGDPDLTGALVNSVIDDSPAKRAGLKTGDIITRFDDTPIETEKEEDLGVFQRLVAGVMPGEPARLQVVRDGERAPLPRGTDREAAHRGPLRGGERPGLPRPGDHHQPGARPPARYRPRRLRPLRGPGLPGEPGRPPGGGRDRADRGGAGGRPGRLPGAMQRASGRDRFLITARRGSETKFLLVKRDVEGVAEPEPTGDAGEAALPHEPE